MVAAAEHDGTGPGITTNDDLRLSHFSCSTERIPKYFNNLDKIRHVNASLRWAVRLLLLAKRITAVAEFGKHYIKLARIMPEMARMRHSLDKIFVCFLNKVICIGILSAKRPEAR